MQPRRFLEGKNRFPKVVHGDPTLGAILFSSYGAALVFEATPLFLTFIHLMSLKQTCISPPRFGRRMAYFSLRWFKLALASISQVCYLALRFNA